MPDSPACSSSWADHPSGSSLSAPREHPDAPVQDFPGPPERRGAGHVPGQGADRPDLEISAQDHGHHGWASSPAVLAVEESYQPGGGDDPVRVLAQLSDFRPVHVAVKPDADPSPAAHIGWPEEPGGLGRGELALCPRQARTPQMRKVIRVVVLQYYDSRAGYLGPHARA